MNTFEDAASKTLCAALGLACVGWTVPLYLFGTPIGMAAPTTQTGMSGCVNANEATSPRLDYTALWSLRQPANVRFLEQGSDGEWHPVAPNSASLSKRGPSDTSMWLSAAGERPYLFSMRLLVTDPAKQYIVQVEYLNGRTEVVAAGSANSTNTCTD